MTLPQIIDLTNGHDVQARDVYHRHQYQMIPTANVLQRLFHHIGGSGPILSAVEAVTLDASSNASWDLMLSKNTAALNANTITTANLAIWSGNAIMSVNPTLAAIRSTNFVVSGNASMGNVSAGQIVNAGTSFRIANTNVLTSTTLGSGITTSSLTSVGTLSTVNVSGNARFGNVIMRGFVRSVGASVGDTVEICQLNASRGGYSVDLSVVQSELNNSINKQYKFSHVFNATGADVWRRLVPFVSSGPSSSNDWAVDINSVSSLATLRLVRTGAAASVLTSNVTCSMTVYQSSYSPVTITDTSGVSTDTTSWPVYRNTLISQLSNNVGIGTDSPANPLDVVGNISCGNVSTNAVIATSMTGTNLTVSGNIISGNARISNTTYRTFTKTLGATVNDSSIICDLTSAAAFGFELAVVQSTSGNAIAKFYKGTSQFNSTGGTWKRLIPFSSTGPSSSRDWAVDLQILNSTGSFRLVRTDTTGTGNTTSLACALRIFNATALVVVNESSTTDVNATNTGYYENTLIGQVDNRVGIGTDNPAVFLDVGGNTNISGTLSVTGNASFGNVSTNAVIATAITGTLQTSSQPNITSVGTLGTLNVTGNVAAGNLSTNSISAGAITVSGPLTVNSSNCIFDSQATVTLTRTIAGSTVGSGVNIGTIGASGQYYGTSIIEITLCSNTVNNSVTKFYTIPFNALLITQTGWRRALPSSGIYFLNDVGIDINTNGTNQLSLALVRTVVDAGTVDTSTSYHIGLTINFNKISGFTLANGWSPSTSVYISTLPAIADSANIASTTPLTQTSYGGVGINTEYPSYNLDVIGSGRFTNGLYLNTLTATGNIAAGNLSTNSISATVITAGNVVCTQPFQGRGVYIPASMGSDTCGINFANKWRIWYNPETEDLEIHKNNNPTDTANIVYWSSYDSTAILASSD